jgi:uncharacterized membrane protein
VAVALLGFAVSAMAHPSAASAITFRACNHTGKTVSIASSYFPVGGANWHNKGWKDVKAGQCADLFQTDHRTFYARAEVKGHSDQYWGSAIKQCVEYPGPFAFDTHADDVSCPDGMPAEFLTFHSDGRPVYVWNLNR